MQQPTPDPVMQAILDSQYHSVGLQVKKENPHQALCAPHGREVCEECGADFSKLNMLARTLVAQPELAIPPPPNIVHPGRSAAVTKAKEEGNAHYKAGRHVQAIQMYTMSLNIAASRPPWEASMISREELSTVLSNRSASFAAMGDFSSALADADAVVQLKRPWSKGHFRKGKALIGLGRLEEAREAAALGLQFEPESTELANFIRDIEKEIEAKKNVSTKA
jgi:translocation protein SEC72